MMFGNSQGAARWWMALVCGLIGFGLFLSSTFAQEPAGDATKAIATEDAKPEAKMRAGGGEASLILPDLGKAKFLGSISGRTLLYSGLVVSALGLLFGLQIYQRLKALPVHESMREVSELIYTTCKTYLLKQGMFIGLLWIIIASVIVFHFYGLLHFEPTKVGIIVAFSVVGILGSYAVAWFGIRVNTFANSRTAFASLEGKPYPVYAIPLQAGMSIGMMLISVELLIMLCILLFVPGEYSGRVSSVLRSVKASGGSPSNRGRDLHEDCRHRRRLDEDRFQDRRRRRSESRCDCRLRR